MFAQTTILHITVIDDATLETLPGVTIRFLPTGRGGISSVDGRLSIEVLPSDSLIKVAYLGYAAVTEPLKLFRTGEDSLIIRLARGEDELEEVIVRSTRTNSRVEDSPIKVEVLGSDDLEEEASIKPGNIIGLVGDYSGIQIQQTGLASGNSLVRIQGMPGRYTQLLRDGLPLYGGMAGEFGILQAYPLDLQQIELIRGPASILYGGGAIAGMINLISKEPGEEPGRSLMLNQNSLGETNIHGWYSGRGEKWGVTCFAGANRLNARDIDKDGFSDVPRQRSFNIHPRLFWYPSEGDKFALGASWVGETRQGGDVDAIRSGASTEHPYLDDNLMHRGVLDLVYEHENERGGALSAKAALGVYNRQRDLPGWQFNGLQQDWFSEISYRKTNGDWRWVSGLTYTGNAFQKRDTDSLAFGDFQNHTLGAFGQLVYHREHKFDVEAGLRLDRHNQYGFFVLPAAAIVYRLTPAFSLRTGLGFGYATPNPLITQEAEEPDLRAVPAVLDDLKAERSLGASIEWTFHRILGETVGIYINQEFFYTRVNRPFLIIAESTGEQAWSNASKPVTTKGLDTYVRLTYEEAELYLGYTYAYARQEYENTQPFVPLTPRHRFASVLAVPLGEKLRIGYEASWNGPQYRYDGTQTPDYWFMAAMIGLKTRYVYFVLNGENLLDFRQTRKEKVVLPPYTSPTFVPLWAPVDGRVINLSATIRF